MNFLLTDIYDIAVDKLGSEVKDESDPQKAGFELGFKAASFLFLGPDFYNKLMEENKTDNNQ